MTVRIDVNSLSDEVRKCLEAGEAVVIERDGEVIGSVEPRPKPRLVDWTAFAEARRKAPPLDEDFETDLEEVLRFTNRPMAPIPWEE